MKIENWSRKRNHELDGNKVGRIWTFSFLPIPFRWKLVCWSRKQKRKTGLFFHFRNFHLIVSDQVISRMGVLLPIPSVQFSLDRITLHFWLRLRPRLLHQWKPVVTLKNNKKATCEYKQLSGIMSTTTFRVYFITQKSFEFQHRNFQQCLHYFMQIFHVKKMFLWPPFWILRGGELVSVLVTNSWEDWVWACLESAEDDVIKDILAS